MLERLGNRRRCVVHLLVERFAPYKGRVYDPCCGSAGMFVQSEKFVKEHCGRIGDISVDGQESNSTTRRLATMNLAFAAAKATSAPSTPTRSVAICTKNLKADYVLANPPFNNSDWHHSDEVIVLHTSIESLQRNPHGHFVRMRRIKAPR